MIHRTLTYRRTRNVHGFSLSASASASATRRRRRKESKKKKAIHRFFLRKKKWAGRKKNTTEKKKEDEKEFLCAQNDNKNRECEEEEEEKRKKGSRPLPCPEKRANGTVLLPRGRDRKNSNGDTKKKKGVIEKKKQETRKNRSVPSGPTLVSSTGDAEKTESKLRWGPKGLFCSSTEPQKAVACSVELVGGHEGRNPLWNV